MITVKDIYKSFGSKEVLQGVSFEMKPGKTNLIIGSSGSGKTVLLKCMIGLLKADSGSVIFDKSNLMEMDVQDKKELRTQIGMLFQGGALFDSKTVIENVMFPLDMFTTKSYREKYKVVEEVLDKVNLKGVNKKFPAEISGGMQKRVALARAIVLKPKYLFCDEPNSGLDPQTSIVIDELIQKLTVENDITTVINTHDMNTVMERGDHIIYMHQGKKQWEGSSKDIIYSDNELLNEFIFASKFFRDAKEKRIENDQLEKEGNK